MGGCQTLVPGVFAVSEMLDGDLRRPGTWTDGCVSSVGMRAQRVLVSRQNATVSTDVPKQHGWGGGNDFVAQHGFSSCD